MTKTNNSQPEAYIAVAGNRQKIYSNEKVYLNGGTEFQLELFNPTQGTVAAKIFINDEAISTSLIVLRPGVREYLDRYLDNNKKFLFDTYKVEDTAAVKEAIANNGNIRIEFFKAQVPKSNPIIINTGGWSGNSGTSGNDWWNNQPYCGTPPNQFGTCTSGTAGLSGDSGPTGPTELSGNSSNVSAFYCSTDFGEDNGHIGMACMDSIDFGSENLNEIETGRVEAGGESDQNFTNYYGEFEPTSFLSTQYQILPSSTQPVEISKIRQYCPACKNRIRKASWVYCPACGGELD